MSATPRGLGRGLDALFKGYEPDAAEQKEVSAPTNTLPIDSLRANPNQPRKNFTEDALHELADSIRAQGVLQPLLVRPQHDGTGTYYEIVAGERRWRASQLAGVKQLPVVIKELSDLETLAVGLIENLQREDLNPMEEALGMQELKNTFGLSQEDLSQKLGKSRSAIANTLRLLQLDEEAREALQEGALSAGHARAILSVGKEVRAEMRERIIAERLTVREAEGLAQYWKQHGELPPTGSTPKPAPKAKTATSDGMKGLQTRLMDSFLCKVNVSGTEDKGKVTLSFTSQAELQDLLLKLGVSLGN